MAAEHQDRYALAARILERLAPELAAEGFDLVDVRIFQGGGRQQVRLYVDLPGEARIDLQGCAEASRSASMILEAADLFAGPWVLEVSSPGIRRPLRRLEHFQAAVGEPVQVRWRSPQAPTERPQQLRGRLAAIESDALRIEPAGEDPQEPVLVPLAGVLEANLDRDFDVQEVIRRDRRRRKDDRKAEREARRQGSGTAAAAEDEDERDGN